MHSHTVAYAQLFSAPYPQLQSHTPFAHGYDQVQAIACCEPYTFIVITERVTGASHLSHTPFPLLAQDTIHGRHIPLHLAEVR